MLVGSRNMCCREAAVPVDGEVIRSCLRENSISPVVTTLKICLILARMIVTRDACWRCVLSPGGQLVGTRDRVNA